MNGEIYYQGHGSLRITTKDGYVIYIDPFAGDGYDKPADLILVTHQHGDHNQINLPARKPECRVWQNSDALDNGKYNSADFGFVKVRATQAYNRNHHRDKCVGYILEFDSIKVYVAGDTSATEQMETMADEKFDYAFLPTDGIFNMGPKEASKCAELIGAKHTIPYHMKPSALFSQRVADKFNAAGKLIIKNGESIEY